MIASQEGRGCSVNDRPEVRRKPVVVEQFVEFRE
jgi:hypothetical protein